MTSKQVLLQNVQASINLNRFDKITLNLLNNFSSLDEINKELSAGLDYPILSYLKDGDNTKCIFLPIHKLINSFDKSIVLINSKLETFTVEEFFNRFSSSKINIKTLVVKFDTYKDKIYVNVIRLNITE